eukprot:499725-Amphidinium_carterae.1
MSGGRPFRVAEPMYIRVRWRLPRGNVDGPLVPTVGLDDQDKSSDDQSRLCGNPVNQAFPGTDEGMLSTAALRKAGLLLSI